MLKVKKIVELSDKDLKDIEEFQKLISRIVKFNAEKGNLGRKECKNNYSLHKDLPNVLSDELKEVLFSDKDVNIEITSENPNLLSLPIVDDVFFIKNISSGSSECTIIELEGSKNNYKARITIK